MSNSLREFVIPINGRNDINVVRVSVDYDIGNYRRQRGYYLLLTPGESTPRGLYYYPQQGRTILILTVSRKSKKSEEQAINWFDANYRSCIYSWLNGNGTPEFS